MIKTSIVTTPSPNKTSNLILLTRSQRRFLWLAIISLLALRVLTMFQVPYTDTTEARYAEIARKMVETNDWITPQIEYGVPFWGKPPLHTWVAAAGMKLFGVNEFGGRIFIFIIGLGVLWLLYRWAKEFRGKDYALIGTVILTSSVLFFIAMASVMTDLVMISGTTLSMVAFWSALHREQGRPGMGYLFFVGLALGLLAKGPVAFVLTAIPIGLWVLVHNRWRDTWLKLLWISGTLLMLAIALPWYLLAEAKTPGFLKYFIMGEHFERFLISGWKGDLYGSGHAKPRGGNLDLLARHSPPLDLLHARSLEEIQSSRARLSNRGNKMVFLPPVLGSFASPFLHDGDQHHPHLRHHRDPGVLLLNGGSLEPCRIGTP